MELLLTFRNPTHTYEMANTYVVSPLPMMMQTGNMLRLQWLSPDQGYIWRFLLK
ncbi:MAG: hypothetical protein IPH20_20260 [Bacteroidales bacterium]|nr:hypothetical protein [Bacteroidales bacterium]